MTKTIIITFYLITFCASVSTGQIYLNSQEIDQSANSDSTIFQFEKIEIIGNKKTKPDVILRELRFQENQATVFKQIRAAHKRVLSLALFTRVKFDIIDDSTYCILLITVYERWYIFPVPMFYLNERSWHKISYGGKLYYYNFLGRNILLKATAAFGYNPVYRFSYYNPWFMGDLKLYTYLHLYHGKVRSRSPELDDYEDTRQGFEWLIGKRFGHFAFAGIILSYVELTAPPEIGLTLSPTGKDYLPSIVLSFQYDNRDLKEYPHQGWFLTFWGKRVGNGNRIKYYRYGNDLRCYVPLNHNMTLALRSAVDLSCGKIPSYDRVYFGYLERIRGRFYEVFEGENLAFNGAELRFPIMKIRYFGVEPLPGFEGYSDNLKFGISAGIFFDSGAVWNQNQALKLEHFQSGVGTGIHFHLPYIDLFRLECGFNKKWKPEAIAEVEVAF